MDVPAVRVRVLLLVGQADLAEDLDVLGGEGVALDVGPRLHVVIYFRCGGEAHGG